MRIVRKWRDISEKSEKNGIMRVYGRDTTTGERK